MNPAKTPANATASTSPGRRDPSMENNRRLFPIFNQRMKSTTTNAYSATANKFALWMSDSKAYYQEARPHIVEILETAHSTLCTALGNETEVFTVAQMASGSELWWRPYIDMLKVAARHFHTFNEPELEHRLGVLMANAGITPVTAPSSHYRKLEFKAPNTPGTYYKNAETGTYHTSPFAPVLTGTVSSAGSLYKTSGLTLSPSSDANISHTTTVIPNLKTIITPAAPGSPSSYPAHVNARASTSSSAPAVPSSKAAAPRKKKKSVKYDFVAADLEWFAANKKATETPQPQPEPEAERVEVKKPVADSTDRSISELRDCVQPGTVDGLLGKPDETSTESFPGELPDVPQSVENKLPNPVVSGTHSAEIRSPNNVLITSPDDPQLPEQEPKDKLNPNGEAETPLLQKVPEPSTNSPITEPPNTHPIQQPASRDSPPPLSEGFEDNPSPDEDVEMVDGSAAPSTDLVTDAPIAKHSVPTPVQPFPNTVFPITIKIPPMKKLQAPETEESESMDCVCSFKHEDGGLAIACDKCSRWCHAVCFNILDGQVPDEWRCWECLPRPVDKERAVKIQAEKLREIESWSPKSRRKRRKRKIGVLDAYVGSPKEKRPPSQSPVKSPNRRTDANSNHPANEVNLTVTDFSAGVFNGNTSIEDSITGPASPAGILTSPSQVISNSGADLNIQCSYPAPRSPVPLFRPLVPIMSPAGPVPNVELLEPTTADHAARLVTHLTAEEDHKPTNLNAVGKRPRSENGEDDEAPNKRRASSTQTPSIAIAPPDEPSLLPDYSIAPPRRRPIHVSNPEGDLVTTKEMETATQKLISSLSSVWGKQTRRSISTSSTSDMVLDSEDEANSTNRPSMEVLTTLVAELSTKKSLVVGSPQIMIPIPEQLSSAQTTDLPAWTIKKEPSEEPSERDELMDDVDLPGDAPAPLVANSTINIPSATALAAPPPTKPTPTLTPVECLSPPPLPASSYSFSAKESRTLLVSTGSNDPGVDTLSFYMDMPQLARIAKWRNRTDDSNYPSDALCLSLAAYHFDDAFASLINGSDGDDTGLQFDQSVQKSKTKCRWPSSMYAWITMNENKDFTVQMPPFCKTADGFVDISSLARCGTNTIQLHHMSGDSELSDYTFVVFVHSPSAAHCARVRERSEEMLEWQRLLKKLGGHSSYPKLDWSRCGVNAMNSIV